MFCPDIGGECKERECRDWLPEKECCIETVLNNVEIEDAIEAQKSRVEVIDRLKNPFGIPAK